MMDSFRSERGFALLQVLIAAGIMGIVALGAATMIANQHASVSALEDRLSKNALQAEIINIFDDSSRCSSMLNNYKISPSKSAKTKIVLTDMADKVIYDPQQSLGRYENLNINSVYLQNLSVPGPNSSGVATLNIETSRIRKGGGPDIFKPIQIKTTVVVDSQKRVVSCVGNGAGACLDYVGSHGGKFNEKINVPADAKVLRIKYQGGTDSWTEGGAEGYDYSCNWGGGEAVIYFGTTLLGGKPAEAGKTLEFQGNGSVNKNGVIINGSDFKWIYGGQVIASLKTGRCKNTPVADSTWQSSVASGGALGALCPTTAPPTTLGPSGARAWVWR